MTVKTPRKRNWQKRCYEAAIEFAFMNETATIVHGWVAAPETGNALYISHAWCELDGSVYDITRQQQPFDLAEYYQTLDIQEHRLRRYTLQEAAKLMTTMNTCGPFDQTLLHGDAITRDRLITECGG